MLTSPLLPIFLTVFADVLGLTIMYPLLPYYAQHFGATPQQVAFLLASYPACQLVSGPLLGRLSDRIGRKPVLLASQLGTFAGFLLLAQAWSLPILFLGRMIDGATAGNLTIAQAYISDVTRPENRTKSFAVIGIAFGVGFLIGPALSGYLSERFSYSAPLYVAACLSMTSVLTTFVLLPKPIPRAPDQGELPPRPSPIRAFVGYFSRAASRAPLVQFACFVFSFQLLVGGLSLFLSGRLAFTIKQTAYVFTLSGVVGALIQGRLIGRLVARLGEARLAATGFATMVFGYVLLAFTDSSSPRAVWITLLCASTCIAGFGAAVVRPCLTTLITKSVGKHEQGAALGVSQSLTSLAGITANPIMGFLMERRLYAAWAGLAAAVALLGVLLRVAPEAPEPAPPT